MVTALYLLVRIEALFPNIYREYTPGQSTGPLLWPLYSHVRECSSRSAMDANSEVEQCLHPEYVKDTKFLVG